MIRWLAVAGLAPFVLLAHCTPDARRALLETATEGATCALKHMDLPDEQILKVCAIEAADVDRILRILGEGRKQAGLAAAQAEERARLAGAQRCGDAGTR